MKILILTVTAGEGHNSTAKGIRAELERMSAENGDEIEAVVLDTFDYLSPELAKFISEGYLFVTERAKYAYRIGYNLAEKRSRKDKPPFNITSYAMAGDLTRYINSYSFDAIVFTHPFAGILLNVLKKSGAIAVPTLGILTDFTFHPYWEDCTYNDYVVVPDKLLIPQGLRKGFSKSQILPLGIPIKPEFITKLDKTEARRKLGLDPGRLTLLLMGGSMGYGNMSENLRKIDKCSLERDFQIICVCGNNREMKEEVDTVSKFSTHNILSTGFVDYISDIMDASDCIITKPGGLTTSESLVKGLPMIIVNPIPGQEERNAQFLTNTGCAMVASRTCPIEECVYQLALSESRISVMKLSISEIAKPNSTSDVCSFIRNLALTPTTSDQLSEPDDGRIYFDVE